MRWFEISKERPKERQLVWLSRPTLKDRTPTLVMAVVPIGVGYGSSVWIKENRTQLAMRPTDQWAIPMAPTPPKLLKGN